MAHKRFGLNSVRISVALAAVLVLFGLPACDAHAAANEFNVRSYGASGNGLTNDSAAVQRANDAAAASRGTVYFPAGTYVMADVVQDSGVTFAGEPGAVLKHPNGWIQNTMVKTRNSSARGTIAKGSRTLRVDTKYRMVPGARVAIRAAGGHSPVVTTRSMSDLDASASRIPVESTAGFDPAGVLLIGDEAVYYQGVEPDAFIGVTRGIWGSTAEPHASGSASSMASVLYATIESVSGLDVTLDREAAFSVNTVLVMVGAIDTTIRDLTFDVNNPRNGIFTSITVGVALVLARHASITRTVISNGIHGAVRLENGTTASTIENNTFSNNGRPSQRLGSAVWLFRGSSANTVRNNRIGGDGYWGITMDDRTETPSEWDAPSDDNLIESNTIDIPAAYLNASILVEGSNDNEIRGNVLNVAETGIKIIRSEQGPKPANAEHNSMTGNVLSNHSRGFRLSGDHNSVTANQINNCTDPIVDTGIGNDTSGNVIVPVPSSAARRR